MRKHLFKNILTCTLVSGMLLLSACSSGKSAQVTEYENNLLSFKAAIEDVGTKIDAIDATNPDACNELLFYVDAINTNFQTLTTLTVPEGYESITRLNTKAAEYMATAADYYHQAYGTEVFNEDAYNTANTYYYKAFEFINYTGQVLQGADISFASDAESGGEE